MNTYIYRVVLGCVVIICYLQQQGWAAPSQTQNGQPSIQQIQINDQLKEEISEDTINRVLLNLSNTLSRIQKRQVVSPAFEEFRQTMRNFFYPLFYCSAKILRRDMQVHYLDTVADDHGECSQNRSYIVPLAGDLLQRYDKTDKALCVDITFYKAYKMKILSKSFANDTDTQQYLGYTDQIINVLRLIQTFHDPTCPDFTDAELLAIYDSYEDRYFWPEDKFCILYSYFRSIQNHGINGMPHKGYGMTLTSLACNYPSWFWNDVTEM